MTESNHQFIRPGQVSPDRPLRDACMKCGRPEAEHQLHEALTAVLQALDIPHPATVGDVEVHDRILRERVLHTVIFLLDMTDDSRGLSREWALDYFRSKLAEHPAEGYRTWDQAVAERHARQDGAR